MRLTIREARPGDEARVVALWQAAGLTVPSNDPTTDFRFALAGPASVILLGEDAATDLRDSVMAGHDGHRGWLYYVASAPGSQRQGIGRQMVRAAESWLRARGVWKVQLLVRETNRGVIDFYERLGFEVAPRTVMARRLDEPDEGC